MSEEFLYENYLHLFNNKYDMQQMFNAICSGKLTCNNPKMKKYLDILAKQGELLNFISFLNDANKFVYTVTVGRDSFDSLADSYTSTKKEIRGFGGSERGHVFLDVLIGDINIYYGHFLKLEQQKRDDAHMAVVDAREVVRKRYLQYVEELKKWNKKDCYWRSGNWKKRPTPVKFNLTEEDLKEFGFYDKETRDTRMKEYHLALQESIHANSFLKKMIYGVPSAPIKEDYGLTSADLDVEYDITSVSNRGR